MIHPSSWGAAFKRSGCLHPLKIRGLQEGPAGAVDFATGRKAAKQQGQEREPLISPV